MKLVIVGGARAPGLDVGPRGGLRVDDRMQTSDPAIWAASIAAELLP